MRLVIIGILLIAAITVIVSGLRGYRKHVSWFALVLTLVPAGALGYFEYTWQETNNKITAVVKKASGNPDASFTCQRLSIGFFDTNITELSIRDDPNTVHLKYRQCESLQGWFLANPKLTPTPDQVKSLQLFAADTVRVSGPTEGQKFLCVGTRELPAIVQLLGGTKEQGEYARGYYQQHIVGDDEARITC